MIKSLKVVLIQSDLCVIEGEYWTQRSTYKEGSVDRQGKELCKWSLH